MRISEEIECTGIFGALPQRKSNVSKIAEGKYCGNEAIAAVDELMASKPPKEVQLVFQETEKEQEKGWPSRDSSCIRS